jgi:hypothetical protein
MTIGGKSTSILELNVSKNATIRTYTIPIQANISFPKNTEALIYGKNYNYNNSESSVIPIYSNVTTTILPSLTFLDLVIETWNKTGSAMIGFISLITAIIGIGGTIGGWFLAKSRQKKQ